MQVDRPGPGEELNTSGTVAEPRQAATVIVLRGGDGTLEVLLVQRTPAARFMGGVWVFPGGAVDTTEGDGDTAHRIAAIRELEEEAAIVLDDPAALVKFSRWITPPMNRAFGVRCTSSTSSVSAPPRRRITVAAWRGTVSPPSLRSSSPNAGRSISTE